MTESDLRVVFGRNLKHFRTFRGLSQGKLAEYLDISSNFISDLETGKRWLSSDTLVNLSNILNIEAYELLMPTDSPASPIQAFITKYTNEASNVIQFAVNQSLEKLSKSFENS
jgi:transcriptional regulator with XRE-family HTH domain